jgi:hypothetical protein
MLSLATRHPPGGSHLFLDSAWRYKVRRHANADGVTRSAFMDRAGSRSARNWIAVFVLGQWWDTTRQETTVLHYNLEQCKVISTLSRPR